MTTFAEQLALDYITSGLLEVDGEGRFWRLARKLGNGNPVLCERERAECRHNKGYLCLPVWAGKRGYHPYAHRVQWAYLHGGQIDDSLEINHLDLDKANNRGVNLELVDHRANISHAAAHGSLGARTTVYRRKFMPPDVLRVRAKLAEGISVPVLAREYCVTPRAIRLIKNRRSYAWVEAGQ